MEKDTKDAIKVAGTSGVGGFFSGMATTKAAIGAVKAAGLSAIEHHPSKKAIIKIGGRFVKNTLDTPAARALFFISSKASVAAKAGAAAKASVAASVLATPVTAIIGAGVITGAAAYGSYYAYQKLTGNDEE